MVPSLHFTRRFAASLALACLLWNVSGANLLVQAAGPRSAAKNLATPQKKSPKAHLEPVSLDDTLESAASVEAQVPAGTLIAHHGGEGGLGSVGALGGTTASAAVTTVKGRVSKTVTSNSLWGNMLLGMAYQRDPEIAKAMKRMQQVNAFTMVSIAGVSGLSLAQSIYSYRQIEPKTYDVTPAHHPGGSDHLHIPEDSRVPATLGIIGSGVTLATLGINTVANGVYGRKLLKRQIALREKVDTIIIHLKGGGAASEVEADLISLVGSEATEEFLSFWQLAHPQVSRQAALAQ